MKKAIRTKPLTKTYQWSFSLLAVFCFAVNGIANTPPASGELINPATANLSAFKLERGATVKMIESDGESKLEVTFPTSSGYPAVDFPIPGGQWDLSQYSGIEVDLTNTSERRLNVALRADNPGNWKKSPWNTQNVWIDPGASKTLKLTFGESYGNPGYNLDPSKVKVIKLLVDKPKVASKVLVTSLKAVGPPSQYSTTPTPKPAATSGAATSAPINGEKILNAKSESLLSSLKTEHGSSVSISNESGTSVLKMDFPASKSYPGVDFIPPTGDWNLSKFGGIEAEITNTSSIKLGVSLRADNRGNWKKSPWSAETAWISPGKTQKITVTFGQNYGQDGFPLDSSKINNIKILVAKPKVAGALLIKSLKGIGTPSSTPTATASSANTSRGPNLNAPPISGELTPFPLNSQSNLSRLKTDQTKVTLDKSGPNPALKATFFKANYPGLRFPGPKGGWNLQPFKGVEAELTNVGEKKVRAGLRIDNPGKWQDSPWNTELSHIAPGETKTIQVVFGEQGGAPAYPLDSNRITQAVVFLEKPRQTSTLLITNIRAFGSAAAIDSKSAFSKMADRDIPVTPPDWIGTRPPVKGDWVMTLDENFEGDTLNTELWTPRLVWDGPAKGEIQRYLEENITVKDGVMSIKCELNPGHQYNNPKLGKRKFTTGAVTTLGKWTQRYGYIEAKIKLPTARGLWPAFWTMPDRGAETGLNIWERRETKNRHGKGMEMDIFEHLTEWGPGRTNIAAHWDGYGSDHKQWGTDRVYYGPTPDGWHVAGLLWEPNKLTWYIDGVKKGEWENDRIIDVPSFLKFTVQMGNWATKDVDVANLPDYFQVDYVRAWQSADRLQEESSQSVPETS